MKNSEKCFFERFESSQFLTKKITFLSALQVGVKMMKKGSNFEIFSCQKNGRLQKKFYHKKFLKKKY